eukprot:CAMPEP_0202897794 /NCGR_PEP_ID=MMETSP1392-20130828/6472_1 /ASSEMBLY_ACC=CAM_ASM_000868 /TAXON_ID=225041 /ORGANISM="Chlamydomonas chlamydogama, Strain SAG 11-48b" /LENGTH=339 /DNA_ID=CAMNT_0049583539 /DNA_START=469 /DNA_END=1485 /DNA_ORIENTATION=+
MNSLAGNQLQAQVAQLLARLNANSHDSGSMIEAALSGTRPLHAADAPELPLRGTALFPGHVIGSTCHTIPHASEPLTAFLRNQHQVQHIQHYVPAERASLEPSSLCALLGLMYNSDAKQSTGVELHRALPCMQPPAPPSIVTTRPDAEDLLRCLLKASRIHQGAVNTDDVTGRDKRQSRGAPHSNPTSNGLASNLPGKKDSRDPAWRCTADSNAVQSPKLGMLAAAMAEYVLEPATPQIQDPNYSLNPHLHPNPIVMHQQKPPTRSGRPPLSAPQPPPTAFFANTNAALPNLAAPNPPTLSDVPSHQFTLSPTSSEASSMCSEVSTINSAVSTHTAGLP